MRDETRATGDDEPPDDGEERGETTEGSRLLRAVRAGDQQALAALYERYVPMLLVEARRRGVEPGLRREVVVDAVTAAVLVLMREGHPEPVSLAGYLVTALRRRVLNLRRAARRDAAHALQVEDIDRLPSTAPVDAPQDTSRVDAPEPPTALDRVVRAATRQLAADEVQLLVWLGDHVPQREIAAWLGVTHDAVRSRAKRLRARLREAVRRHVAALPAEERTIVERRLAALSTGAAAVAARPAPARRRGERGASRREP